MILSFSGVCQHCAQQIKQLVYLGRPLEQCPDCGEPPFALKPFPGLIYIVSNPNQRGVKIGLTGKSSIEQRLRSLSATTGVPGKFEVVALFPSKRPPKDEKLVHEKVHKYRISKEHFDLEPLDAVLKTYRALKRRDPIIEDQHVREAFLRRVEEDRETMARRLRGERAED